MPRITPWDARAILTLCGCACADDFHALNTDKVERLLLHANANKYRKPANANGSRARYFHAYLVRQCRKTFSN
jgi:hypothetical protein